MQSVDMERGRLSVDPKEATDLLIVTGGEVRVSVSGISYSLTDGELIVIPKIPYVLSPGGNSAGSAVRFRLSRFQYSGFEENAWPFLREEAVLTRGGPAAQVAAVARQIESEVTEEPYGYEQSAEKLLFYLLILLERNLSESAGEDLEPDGLLGGIRSYIGKHYEQNITLAGLAEMFFVSPFHISHMFKEKYGISPIQYLINVRIQAAQNLLAQTKHTISDVSSMVGYPNVNYFHILFKRFTGMSPGSYRRRKQ
jgi:AraC-like DNA-binding protein